MTKRPESHRGSGGAAAARGADLSDAEAISRNLHHFDREFADARPDRGNVYGGGGRAIQRAGLLARAARFATA